jgi:hypothetical protein
MNKELIIIETCKAYKTMQDLFLMVNKSDTPDIIVYDAKLKEHIASIRAINTELKKVLQAAE